MEALFYIPQNKPLTDAVQYFWQVNRCNIHFKQETIIPKGNIEIIFNFFPDTTFNGKLYNKVFTMPKCFIQGYHTHTIELALPERQFLFGVVLHSTAIKHFLKIPPSEFAGQCIDLSIVDASFNTLWHQLAEQKTFNKRIAHFSEWMTKRLSNLNSVELELNDLLELRNNIPLSVSKISEWLNYSPRHLSRIFYELTGLNSEQTILYLKYLKAINLIHQSNLSLTQIAYASEFSDQSHFIKTFKLFTALTPKAYRNKKSNISGHYFEDVR